jgi:glucokinase
MRSFGSPGETAQTDGEWILAGDIGGTKCTLSLFARVGNGLNHLFRFSVATRNLRSLPELFAQFRTSACQQGYSLEGKLLAAAFGVAGTIVGDEIVVGNLPWPIQEADVAHALAINADRVLFLNDLVATAHSLMHLEESDVLRLNQGEQKRHAPVALIAAGTGLGEAVLFWDGDDYQVSPSEAGLTDFAPRNDRELLLLQSLRRRTRRVCTEEIISGRGFRVIHQAIFPDVLHSFFDDPTVDTAAQITQQAFADSCTACVETLQIWTEAYGAEAGNLALRILPFGGVYVAGGIALKILPKLKDGTFVQAFSDKLQLSRQLAKIPIFVVLNEDAPVLGAAYQALAQYQS